MDQINKKMKDYLILISSGNFRAILSLIRTLENINIDYIYVLEQDNDPILNTIYTKNILKLKNFIQNIEIIKKKYSYKKYVIIPPSETKNIKLLNNKNIFSDDIIIPLVDKELYKKISNKHAFYNTCVDYKIVVPKIYKNVNNTVLPFVAKPFTNIVKDKKLKPILIFNKKQLDNFKKNHNTENYFCQEYVDGKSYYLLYYFYKDGSCLKFSQQNIVQQPQGGSIVAARPSNIHNDNISELYEKMFKSLNFRGLVMVDLMKRGNKFYMIEANPRLWGPSQLFVDNGVNLFEALLYDYGVINKKPTVLQNQNQNYLCEKLINKDVIYYENIDVKNWNDIYKRGDM